MDLDEKIRWARAQKRMARRCKDAGAVKFYDGMVEGLQTARFLALNTRLKNTPQEMVNLADAETV